MDVQLVRSQDHRLEVQGKPEVILIVFSLIWASGFGGTPLMALPFVGSSLMYDLGSKTFSCQRTSSQVLCQQRDEKLFGLATPVVQRFPPLKQAKFNRFKTPKSQPVNWLTVVTKTNQEIPVFATEWNQRGLTGDAQTIQAWANKINQFLNSQENSLILEYPISQQWHTLILLIPLSLFPLIALAVIFLVFQFHSLTIDRTDQTLTYRHSTLFGSRSYTYDWKVVKGINLVKKRGNKGSTFYELSWSTDSAAKLPKFTTGNLHPLQEMTQQLGTILGVIVTDHTGHFS